MRIKPYAHLFSSLVFLILLTTCSPNHPDNPVAQIETPNPQPSPNAKSTPATRNGQVSSLSPGTQDITGVVLGGGDQTPEGLLGGPRTFAYQVQLESGEVITLTYTAYPPSPGADAEPKPKLNFHNGTISPGDRLTARGTYDPTTKTLTVATETDFIKTFAE
jgi:hypothetical protein